jgi:hypothetical protein
MAQKKFLFIGSYGPEEHNPASDDLTIASLTVTSGPAASSAGVDMNNTDLSDVNSISFTDPSADGLVQTAGLVTADNLMAKDRGNTLSTAADVTFPVITDVAGQVDALRLPALAGAPTATPASGGAGHMVYDSTNKKMYVYDGAAWDSLDSVESAQSLKNGFTVGAGGVAARDAVYISAADTVSKANADTSTKAQAIGFAASAAAAAASVQVQSEGVVSGFTGLTPGAIYFLDSSDGAISASAPTGSGHRVLQVGVAKSATQLFIQFRHWGVRS